MFLNRRWVNRPEAPQGGPPGGRRRGRRQSGKLKIWILGQIQTFCLRLSGYKTKTSRQNWSKMFSGFPKPLENLLRFLAQQEHLANLQWIISKSRSTRQRSKMGCCSCTISRWCRPGPGSTSGVIDLFINKWSKSGRRRSLYWQMKNSTGSTMAAKPSIPQSTFKTQIRRLG